MENVKYLLIGNGIASLSAIREIRKNDSDGSICVVSNEAYNTYYRIRLTELIAKEYTKDEILVNPDAWYKENKIEVKLRKIVESVDYKNKLAHLDDGSEIKYEKLLIATGSRPFIPPITGSYKKGFFALRSLNDLEYIKKYLEDKKEVAVIGGGLLGLEAAWALKELGKEVSIIEFSSHLLNRQLDEELSIKLEEKLKNLGFNLYLNAGAEEIIGKDDITSGVRLSTGEEIEVGGVLVSSGVRPDLRLAIDTELDYDRGIKVNNKLETNIEGVYSAGDVIQIGEVVLGLWTAANEQGRVAGANMSGGSRDYDIPKLFAALDIGDIHLFSAGKVGGVDEVYEKVDGDNHSKLFVEDGKLVGSILFGDTKAMGKFRKAVFAKEDINKFIEDNKLVGYKIK